MLVVLQAHLREHVTCHTNVRQYLCEICGSAFKTRSVQRKHVQTIHKNPRSYSCDQCDKRFNTKYALNRHVRTHDTPGMRTFQQQALILDPSTVQVLAADTPVIQDLSDTTSVQQMAVVSAAGDTQQISTETIQATASIQDAYQQPTTADVKQIPQGYIQTNDGTTLVYLTNLPAL